MTRYLLDTNACVALINGSPPEVRRRFERVIDGGAVVLLSSIESFELSYGVGKSQRKALNAARLETFLAGPLEWTVFEAQQTAGLSPRGARSGNATRGPQSPAPAEEMDGVFQGRAETPAPPTRPVSEETSDGPPREQPPEWVKPKAGPMISAGQAKRLWAIAYSNNWNNAQVNAMLASFGFKDTADIPRNSYEEVITLLERGPKGAGA